MDRERDRDAAVELIEEHDKKEGGGEPERVRPGQDDPKSRAVDAQRPPQPGKEPEPDTPPPGDDPGPLAPRRE